MKIRIENGITIITTQDPVGGLKNKNGFRGIQRYGDRYRADITVSYVKYSLGIFSDFETAKKARLVAEKKKRRGDLDRVA